MASPDVMGLALEFIRPALQTNIWECAYMDDDVARMFKIHKTRISDLEGPEDMFKMLYKTFSGTGNCYLFISSFRGKPVITWDGRCTALDEVKRCTIFQFVADLSFVRLIVSDIEDRMRRNDICFDYGMYPRAVDIGADPCAFDKSVFFFMCELGKIMPSTVKIIRDITSRNTFKKVIKEDQMLLNRFNI